MTTPEPRSREEHLARCKQHALAYLDAGDLRLAWLSMTSDMRRHRLARNFRSQPDTRQTEASGARASLA